MPKLKRRFPMEGRVLATSNRARSLRTRIVVVGLWLLALLSPPSSAWADDSPDDTNNFVEQMLHRCDDDFVMVFEPPQLIVLNCRSWQQLDPTLQEMLLGSLRDCDEYYRQDLVERKTCYAIVLGYLVGPKPMLPDPDEIWFID
jgi:hypothetical protein